MPPVVTRVPTTDVTTDVSLCGDHLPASQVWGAPGESKTLQRKEREYQVGTVQQEAGQTQIKGRHLPSWGRLLREGQDIPEEDGVTHAEELLLAGDEGHSLHGL